MFTSEFEYEAPTSVDEAIRLMDEHGFDGRVLAGGHSLLPMMKLRLAAPAVIIDINGLDELKGWNHSNGKLRIGAIARQAELEEATEHTSELQSRGHLVCRLLLE